MDWEKKRLEQEPLKLLNRSLKTNIKAIQWNAVDGTLGSAANSSLFGGYKGNQIHLGFLDMATGELQRAFKCEGESLNAIDQFAGDGNMVLYCTSDNIIASWDSRTPREDGHQKFVFRGENPRDLQVNPSNPSEFMVGDTQGRLWVASP